MLKSNHNGYGDEYQHTYLNREYDLWYGKGHRPNVWKIRSKSSTILLDETSDNIDDLKSFLGAVEDVDSIEKEIIIKVGGGAAAIGFTTYLSGGTATTVVSGVFGLSVINSFINLNRACNDADYYYNEIDHNYQNN